MRSGDGETFAICILVCSMLASHWQGRKELSGQITYWDRLYDAALSLDTERQALLLVMMMDISEWFLVRLGAYRIY